MPQQHVLRTQVPLNQVGSVALAVSFINNRHEPSHIDLHK